MDELSPTFWLDLINESGLPLVGCFVLGFVCWRLFRMLWAVWQARIDDRDKTQARLEELQDKTADLTRQSTIVLRDALDEIRRSNS